MLAQIVAAGGAFAGHAAGGTGGMQIQLWQIINLVGAPLLAVLFARPVIDDLKAWIVSERSGPG